MSGLRELLTSVAVLLVTAATFGAGIGAAYGMYELIRWLTTRECSP